MAIIQRKLHPVRRKNFLKRFGQTQGRGLRSTTKTAVGIKSDNVQRHALWKLD
jgi:hypothetical protein